MPKQNPEHMSYAELITVSAIADLLAEQEKDIATSDRLLGIASCAKLLAIRTRNNFHSNTI